MQAALTLINSDQDGDSSADMQECMDLYVHRTDKQPKLIRSIRNTRDRKILGSVKRVFGGAFSGFSTNDDGQSAANTIVNTFKDQAALCCFRAGSSTKARHKKLLGLANKVVALLKQLLGHDVEVHLKRLAGLLMNRDMKTKWSVFTNNCQMFVDRLLRGKDFEYTFPRFPKRLDDKVKSKHPRYLISFGDSVDGASSNRQQSSSFVSSFCKNKRDQCDMIEYIVSRIQRRQSDPTASLEDHVSSWMTLLLEHPSFANPYRQSNATANLLWEMPRDTLSIIQTHMFRPMHKYVNARSKPLDQLEWMENRLLILQQLDIFASLAGGLGSALFDMFRKDQTSILKVIIPKSRVFGTIRADERVKVVGPSWFLSYFIVDSRNSDTARLLDSPDSDLFFKQINQALYRGWSKIVTKLTSPEHGNQLRTIVAETLDPVIQTWLAIFCASFRSIGLTPHLSISIGPHLGILSSALRAYAFQVMKRKLYGQEDWLVFSLGTGISVLQQSFKKSKAIRK